MLEEDATLENIVLLFNDCNTNLLNTKVNTDHIKFISLTFHVHSNYIIVIIFHTLSHLGLQLSNILVIEYSTKNYFDYSSNRIKHVFSCIKSNYEYMRKIRHTLHNKLISISHFSFKLPKDKVLTKRK